MSQDEAPVFPPPPAYYALFARVKTSAVGDGTKEDEETIKFPLPPPAFPRSENQLRVFHDPVPYLAGVSG